MMAVFFVKDMLHIIDGLFLMKLVTSKVKAFGNSLYTVSFAYSVRMV